MNNKFKSLLLVVFFIMTKSIVAQNYDFNQYKFRFQKYRGFNTNYYLNNRVQVNSSTYDDTLYNTSNSEKNFNRNFNGQINLNYFKNVNSENLQNNTNASFNFGVSSYKNGSKIINENRFSKSDNSNDNNSNGMNLNIYYSNTNRIYNDNAFTLLNFSTNMGINLSKNNAKSKNTGTDEFIYNRFNTYNTFDIGKGRGRLEYVTDAIMSGFLIKDLQEKAGVKTLSNDQLESIAKGITSINNQRYLDFRFRLIDQLEMLDSVLAANGITNNKSIAYFTTINDNWLYATNLNRTSGKRWTYYLSNSVEVNRNTYINDYKINFNKKDKRVIINRFLYNSLALAYDQSKQLSLTKQRSWGFNVNSGINHVTYFETNEDSIGATGYLKNETKTKPDALFANANFYYQYLYQPNTRTYLTASVNSGYRANRSLLGLRTKNDPFNLNYRQELNLGLNLNYFQFINARFSYNLDVNFNTFISKINYIVKDVNPVNNSKSLQIRNGIFYNFAASLNYALF